MKVIQFIHGLSMGGAESLVKEYCLQLDNKCELVLLCMERKGWPNEKIISDAGIKVIYISDLYEKKLSRGKFKKIQEFFYKYFYVRKVIREENPDVIHYHLELNRYILFANCKKKTKLVYTIHSEIRKYWNGQRGRVSDLQAMRLLIKKKKLQIIVLHEEMRREANSFFGVSNAITVNNGIDFKRFSNPLPKEKVKVNLGLTEDAFVIGHVGRFIESKNHFFILDIFEEIRKINDKAVLVTIGNGKLKNIFKEKVQKKGLDECVLMLENRTDIPDLMNMMDIFLFPSTYEGLPVVMIEAQKLGIKCVMSDRVTNSCIVSNLVKVLSLTDTAKSWAEQICLFTVNEVIYKNIEIWDMKNVVNKLIDIYKGNI